MSTIIANSSDVIAHDGDTIMGANSTVYYESTHGGSITIVGDDMTVVGRNGAKLIDHLTIVGDGNTVGIAMKRVTINGDRNQTLPGTRAETGTIATASTFSSPTTPTFDIAHIEKSKSNYVNAQIYAGAITGQQFGRGSTKTTVTIDTPSSSTPSSATSSCYTIPNKTTTTYASSGAQKKSSSGSSSTTSSTPLQTQMFGNCIFNDCTFNIGDTVTNINR